MDTSRLIVNPKSGDTKSAEEILHDLAAVLRQHGCILAHARNFFVLAKVEDDALKQARVIAAVTLLTGTVMEWKEIDWSGDLMRAPQ